MAGAYDFAVIVRAATIQDIAMFVAKRLSTLIPLFPQPLILC